MTREQALKILAALPPGSASPYAVMARKVLLQGS